MAGVSIGNAVTYLTADRSELTKELKTAEKQVEGSGSKFGSVLSGVGMAVGLGIANIAMEAAGQITAYMGDAIGAASDMGETVSKTGVLFGEATDAVLAWSENAATALGQSQQQALDAAATFATFGKAAGLTGEDLQQFSTDFVGLSSDLASFNNTTPEQAIQAIGAALRGESEPLRAYGVLLDDASMRNKALQLGLIETTKEALTPQQKVLAAQALIYEQTSAAQGDFARTSGGLANQQRILDAQMQNMQTTIGQALLPVVLALTTQLNSLVQAVLPPLVDFIQNRVTPVFQAMADLIGPAIQTVIGWFTQLGTTVQGQTDGPFAYMATWWAENLPRLQQLAEQILGGIMAFWAEWGDEITATVTTLLTWMTKFWDTQLKTILDIVQLALQVLTGDWEGAGETLKGIVDRWYLFVSDAFDAIWNTISRWFAQLDLAQLGRNLIQGIADGIVGAAGLVYDALTDAVGGSLDAMKSWLGIASPSKRAADEIGAPTAEGVAMGFRSSLEALTADLAGGLEGLFGGLQPAPAFAGATAGAPSGPLNITINNYGVGDARGVNQASEGGVLSALRSAGWRG
jgi:hypothetical protein